MFRKVSKKRQVGAKFRERIHDDVLEEYESKEVTKKVRRLTRGAEFRTRDEDEERKHDDVDGAWASSRSLAPMDRRGGAFEMNEVDTAPDAPSLQVRNEEGGQVGADTKVYQGASAYKSYIKISERAGKYTGTKGPIRAPQFLRNTCRFDYQPDVCKDYKDTGYCGYGDSCKFLHDRGDYKTGWQLEKEFEEKKRRDKEREMLGQIAQLDSELDVNQFRVIDDNTTNLPFACHICRGPFRDPMMTLCGHYFCQTCIQTRFDQTSTLCPICEKQTSGVLNRATKLLGKAKAVGGFDTLYTQSLSSSSFSSNTNT